MNITPSQLTKISQMMDGNKSEAEIISWVDSQDNAEQIFEWFNKLMQGYAEQTSKK